MKKTICFIGGGNLTHVCIGALSQNSDLRINLLTRSPQKWSHELDVIKPDGEKLVGKIDAISSDPADVIPNSDIVLLCMPAFGVEETIVKIKPYIDTHTIVGSIVANTGFFLFCHDILPRDTKLFGFQRVPYVARLTTYGKEARLLGYRDKLYMAVENIDDRDSFCNEIAYLFGTPTELVESFWEVTLSNSNPILHTGRVYSMWKDWDGTPYKECPLFYKDWTDEASRIEIQMDHEYFSLLKKLGVNTDNIETLLTHYESSTPEEMTQKLRSIESLSTIVSPMKRLENGWIPDFSSRYFTEDFPFGLRFIKDIAKKYGVMTPMIDKVYSWGSSKIIYND